MKFYIAAHISQKAKVIRICQFLKRKGHNIPVEWASLPSVAIKGRNRNPERPQQIAIRDMEGIRSCDIFILLSEPSSGRAKYVELGAAIATFLEMGKPRIFILGKKKDQSIFYFHPAVERMKTISDILAAVEKGK